MSTVASHELVLAERDVSDWCQRHLGSRPARELFRAGDRAYVIGLQLEDEREVVVRARLESPDRVRVCLQIQTWLASANQYPCPRPLTGATPLRELVAHAETYRAGGVRISRGPATTVASAVALARLMNVTTGLVITVQTHLVDELRRTIPPWAWPQHEQGAVWPYPDDRDFNLHQLTEPAWLNTLAAQVRGLIRDVGGDPVIGPVNWTADNLRWSSAKLNQLRVVHGWDSLAAQPEPVIAGFAAAMHTMDGDPHTEATIKETRDFLIAYTRTRRIAFTAQQTRLAWAAGLWVRAYQARIATLDPGGGKTALARLAQEATERLRRAGLSTSALPTAPSATG